MDHIRRMGSREAPFFPETLGLVYRKLIEKTFTRPVPSGFVEVQVVGDPAPPPKASASISSVPPALIRTGGTQPSSPLPPIPSPTPPRVPSVPPPRLASLLCNQCGGCEKLTNLYDGTRCPRCPERVDGRGRPYMQCGLCSVVRVTPRATCVRQLCQANFI